MGRFTPVPQGQTDSLKNWTGHETEIAGDCDDYASAAYARIQEAGWQPGLIVAKSRRNGAGHIMACTYNRARHIRCMDNVYGVINWTEVRHRYRQVNYRTWPRN